MHRSVAEREIEMQAKRRRGHLAVLRTMPLLGGSDLGDHFYVFSDLGPSLPRPRPPFKEFPVPISTLGGWHPDAHRALCSVATTIAARGMSTFSAAKSILFQRHAAFLVTNNALCLMSGLLSGI